MRNSTRYLVALHLGAVGLLLLSTAFPPGKEEKRAQSAAAAIRELSKGNERFVSGRVQPATAGLSVIGLPSAAPLLAVTMAAPDGAPAPAALFDLPESSVHTIAVGSDPDDWQRAVQQVEAALPGENPLVIVVLHYGNGAAADLSDGMMRALEERPQMASAIHRSAVRLAIAAVDPETWRTSVR
jgi:hypothetical protein